MLLISMMLNLDLKLCQEVAFMLNAYFIKLKYFLQNVSKKVYKNSLNNLLVYKSTRPVKTLY